MYEVHMCRGLSEHFLLNANHLFLENFMVGFALLLKLSLKRVEGLLAFFITTASQTKTLLKSEDIRFG